MQTLGNKIELKTISELLNLEFFIPSYQRGYRWREQQVVELLDDIDSFRPKEDEWYCLQPLVVKKKDESIWEVIDGQQRLTTIFLIIHYFNEMWIGKQKINEPKISYQTRMGSYDFLKNMVVKGEGNESHVDIDDSNIDYWHISKAYSAINDWVKNKGNFDNNEFQSKFKEKTKVIWYETDPIQDAVEIFTRINMGKIPLTNAELIKALFLNRSNFQDDNAEIIRLKQLEIATEWDNIEYTLHNDEFWLFLNQNENDIETRIEFIFELIVGKGAKDDKNFLFREYSKRFLGEKEKAITSNWKLVKRYFQTMQDWFDDRELYHKIGFLITSGTKLRDLTKESFDKTKSEFINFINSKIKTTLSTIQLEELSYSDKSKVRAVLLLHNIQTMLNNTKENSRFPFNRYKRESWNIEHIHAVSTEMPKTEQHQKDWLQQVREFIPEGKSELLNRIENYSNESFESLYEDILDCFAENQIHEDIDELSNLVLLDETTNKSYKNAVFPVKRKTIINKEKEGTFVPLCTKNVFMKYYNSQVEQMTFWGEKDRTNYFEDIKRVIGQYLTYQE